MADEKYINQIFKGLDIEHEIDLEDKIMEHVDKQLDHSVRAQRYKLMSKIGLIVSSLLAIIIGYLYVLPIFSKGLTQPSNGADIVMPYVYSITTLLAIYIQIEFYNFKNKKGSQI